jgi:broad specificity phosphatase PhoE
MTTELLLVRHGQTESNMHGLLHGRTDVPLTEFGLLQAESVATRLATFSNLASLYTSPLLRARATAEPISRRTGLRPRTILDLAEFDFGDLEGYTYEQIQVEFPDVYLRLLDPLARNVPFPNGESPQGFHERVASAMRALIREHRGERIVVVAHGGVIGTSIAWLTNDDLNDTLRYSVRNCSVTHVEVNERSAEIHCLDDTDHLLELETQEVAP